MEYDRFDLEQQIMKCWQVTEDIQSFEERLIDGVTLTEDEQANILIGLRCLYNIKFEKLWEMFESMIRDGKIK